MYGDGRNTISASKLKISRITLLTPAHSLSGMRRDTPSNHPRAKRLDPFWFAIPESSQQAAWEEAAQEQEHTPSRQPSKP